MPHKVAVESSLTNLALLLQNQGYTVVSPADADSTVSVVVVSALGSNTVDIQHTTTPIPVIDIKGKTPDQIMSKIRRYTL